MCFHHFKYLGNHERGIDEHRERLEQIPKCVIAIQGPVRDVSEGGPLQADRHQEDGRGPQGEDVEA